jgi:hypothetical protein
MTTQDTAPTEPTIQDVTFARALRLLDTVGAQYAIVYGGKTHGTLELAPPPKVKRKGPGLYPPGVLRAHFLPYLADLKPGETAKIPYGGYDGEVLQSNVSAYCSVTWGNQSASSRRYDRVGELHVLRFVERETLLDALEKTS